MKKQYAATALALLILTLTACGGGGGAAAPAMGRYVEEQRALPEGIRQVLALRTDAAGTLDMLCYMTSREQPERWVELAVFHSDDAGNTWEPDETDLDSMVEAQGDVQVEAACWDDQGRLYLFAYDYGATEENGKTEGCFFRMDEGGALGRLPFQAPEDSNGAMVRSFRAADNGDLLVDCWWSLFHVDGETGEVRNAITPKSGSVEGYAVQGNQAVWCREDRLVFYDMEQGEESGEVWSATAVSSSNDNSTWSRLAEFAPDGTICYADTTGIYRARQGNSMLEQVVDGSLTSLSTPSFLIQNFAVLEDSFLILSWTEEGWELHTYVYDPEVPTLPGKELRIWSMEEDMLLRQAIGVFQREHTDVYISYEIGCAGEEGFNWEDALKSLSTQLLAGKGPDVLDLTGLPWESYAEKGVLLDLSGDLAELSADGELLENIAGACVLADGICPALPAQFDVPLLHGSSAAIAASRDLRGLADWLESNRKSFNHPLAMEKLYWLLSFFSIPEQEAIQSGDWTVLTEFLSQMKRIWDMEKSSPIEDGQDGKPEFNFGALNWSVDGCGMDMGLLCTFGGLYPAWQTSKDKGDGETDTLFGGGLFSPRTMLGVNARSGVSDLARAFLRTALSEEVQSAGVGGGIPINSAAFEASVQTDEDPARGGYYSTYGTTLVDREGADVPIFLHISYPPEEYRRAWARRIRSLDQPVFQEGAVQSILENETADFFAGGETLEDAVERLAKKLELYRAEQGN